VAHRSGDTLAIDQFSGHEFAFIVMEMKPRFSHADIPRDNC
jgi:hypothetical protein